MWSGSTDERALAPDHRWGGEYIASRSAGSGSDAADFRSPGPRFQTLDLYFSFEVNQVPLGHICPHLSTENEAPGIRGQGSGSCCSFFVICYSLAGVRRGEGLAGGAGGAGM